MVDIAQLRVGDKVHYIPFKGCDPSLIENGRIKRVDSEERIFVVYKCASEWDKFLEYTGQNTPIDHLVMGWYDGTLY